MDHFGTLMFTEAVRAEQQANGSRMTYARITAWPAPEAVGEDEIAFVEARDSFYMFTVSETVWPYVQHHGGPARFLRALGPQTLGFADYGGNRQFVSTGNLEGSDRVILLLMDYPRKARLKIMDHASWTPTSQDA